MKAMCPDCAGKGCDKCEDGYYKVGIADGDWYTMQCNDCEQTNGILIVPEGNKPHYRPMKCIECRSENVCWQYVGTT